MTPLELKEVRARLGFTQEQLAAKLDVTRQSVARWEVGTCKISRILTLAIEQLERAHHGEQDRVLAATKFLEGNAGQAHLESKELNDLELQRILWACLTYWNSEPNPVDGRAVCYSWVVRCYEAKFGRTFHHSTLLRLVRLGWLTKDKTSRCGTRRYYRINAPAQLTEFLNGCKLEIASSRDLSPVSVSQSLRSEQDLQVPTSYTVKCTRVTS
jgi:DNA-binding XRE family transcriptional regulator